jgi:citrate synthase
VDHGPQAPSIAIARMAATCGVGLNNAMASAVNVLGDVHGGAGEQAVELYEDVAARMDAGESREAAAGAALDAYIENHGKFVSGFGHRFHPVDPRAPRLLALVDEAAQAGEVSGRYAGIARAIEAELAARKGKTIPMNIDGATAVIYAELGFPAPLARGLFCLSRSVGILAHAWEQTRQGGRNKGPIPRQYIPLYEGHPPRPLPAEALRKP